MPGAIDSNLFLAMIDKRVSIQQASERPDTFIGTPIASYDLAERRVVMAPIESIEQVDVSGEPSYRMLLEDGTVLLASESAQLLARRKTGATFVPVGRLRKDDRVVCDSTMGWTRDLRIVDMIRWRMFFGFQVSVEGGGAITANRVVVRFS